MAAGIGFSGGADAGAAYASEVPTLVEAAWAVDVYPVVAAAAAAATKAFESSSSRADVGQISVQRARAMM